MTRLTEQEYAEVLQRTRRKPKPQAATLPAISEKDFQQQVKDLARMLGWKTYHTLQSKGSDPGFPDLIAGRRCSTGEIKRTCLPGTCLVMPPKECICSEELFKTCVLVAELKREGENPTPGQLEWLDFFKEIGAETYVWRPSDWKTIQRVLR